MAYTLTDTVSYKGETLTLNKPAKVGYALNGRPFIVSDTVSLSWTSSSTPSVLVGSYWANGAMFDPRFIGTDLQGADGIIGALSGSQGAAAMPYSHPVNTDPGANGAFALTGKCGRIVKTIRKAGMTAPDATWSVFDKCLFIDVVPSVPPAGAVCPIYDGMGGVQWVTSAMMRKSVLRGCGYVAGQQTLAACKAGGYIPDIDIPYMFDNGEERRIWHSIGTWPGYGSDEAETRYGPLLSAMHAEGAAGVLDADWWALMSVACSITENSRRGHIMRGGAGQNNGQKPLTVTLAMSTRDATIAANALAYEGNETHQQFWLTADWMGAGTPGVYPGSASSHGGYFKSPFEPEQIGTPQWFHGGQALPPSPLSDLSGIDGDIMARYQVVSSPAAMLGFTNMGLLQDGPGGVDGLTFLLNGGATNSTNPYAAPHAYYEWYRTADSGMTSSAEHIAFVLPLYDLMRGLSSVPRMPSAPQAFCPQYNQTNYINATTGGFSLDFTNAGNKTETITRLDLRYTMDGGRTFLNDLNVTRPTYSRSDFPRQYPIGIQNKRYSTSGESVWTRNTPKIAAAFLTITTVAGSKTATVASVASGDILTVGWTLMAQGVLHGDTTIASFGTYDNTTKVGTILLTKPAVKTQASAVQAYAGIGRFLITATGSASGAAVNAQAPQIVKRRYPTLAVERYDPADATTAVGATLYGGVGWWTGDLTAGFTFSWKVEGVEVSTADQYTVQSGDASITLDVTNAGVTATSSNTINNIALAFTSAASGNVAESATLSHTLTATRPATWAIRTSGQDAASVDYAQFEISGSTLRWVSNGTKDYEAPADTGANNTYVVVVRATNAYTGQTVDQTITYTVTDVVEGSESYYDFASGAAGQELTAFLPAWTRDSTEARVASNGAGALRRLGTTAATHFYREGVNTSGTQRAGMTFLTSGTQQLQLAVFGLWSGEAFSGYSVYASAATTLLVRKWVAGVGSTLATITVAAATGVAFELEAHDTGTATELKVFAAGVQQGTTAVDSAGTRRASGYNGIYNEGSTTLSSPMADDFRGNIQF